MKREFLEKYGLEKEQIDEILNEHSSGIGKAKGDVEAKDATIADLQTQLTERDKDIEDLSKQTGNSAELQTKLQDLQTKYDEETEASKTRITEVKRDSAIEVELTKAGAKNLKAAKALLDLDKIEIGDDGVKGLSEQITALGESDGYLFGSGESTGQFTAGGNPTGTEANEQKGMSEIGKSNVNLTQLLTQK